MKKLIRDKIPAILKAEGIEVELRTLSDQEFKSSLKEKLLEEANEVQQAASLSEITEELADTVEVLHALAKAHGIEWREVEERRLKKCHSKGGYKMRLFARFIPTRNQTP